MRHVIGKKRRRRGLMVLEVVISLVIALALLMMLTAATWKLRRAERQLTEIRAEYRRLEGALLSMQSGGTADKELAVERLGGSSPAGMVWVRVSVSAGEKSKQSVVGLVPEAKAPAGGQP